MCDRTNHGKWGGESTRAQPITLLRPQGDGHGGDRVMDRREGGKRQPMEGCLHGRADKV